MAKSSRRKKLDRAKADARRAEQSRRRARVERHRQQSEHYRQLVDPRTQPAEVARLVAAEMADTPIAGAIALMRLDAGVPAGELAETARLLLLASAPEPTEPTEPPESAALPGLGVLAFAASAAHAAGDEDTEHRHTAAMLARADAEDDVALRLEVIRSIAATGHPGEAIELIEPHLRDEPDDEHAAGIYATAVARAYEEAEDTAPGGLERAALARFADRSGLVALRDAIDGYLERTKWGEIVRSRVGQELATVAGEDWQPADREAFAALAFEAALTGADDRDDGDENLGELIERDRREGPSQTTLTAFAADPSAPAALASRASGWEKHVHSGVWQLADPVARPGVWCTDLVSGTRRYAEFPAAVLDGAPPWTVWLGSLGPVDGIWRASGTGVRLSPAEGDAVAEYAEQAVSILAQAMAGVPRDKIPERQPIRFGRAEPYGVRWEFAEPPGEQYARFASKVTSALVTQLFVYVTRYRATPPKLRNTDDEPMLLIDATITVTGDVTEPLLAHPDFSRQDDGDRTRIVWWGKEVPAAQRDTMLAEVRARGQHPVDEPGKPQRWVRGDLTLGDGVIQASVNSRERLDRLVRILTQLGASPAVTAEKRVDPALDFAWGPGPPAAVAGAAPAAEGWEKSWLDERVPALGGRTPRQAADGDGVEVIRLESLLRQFEYQAGLAVSQGSKGIDVAWLRAELGMPGPEQD